VSRGDRWDVGYNVLTGGVGAICAPFVHHALHTAGGDQYGLGVAVLLVVALVDRRAGRWWTHAAVYAAGFGLLLDLPAVMAAAGWLTGVRT
jgi:hypothetical protein